MSQNVTRAILGEKLGMTQIFDEDGMAVPVTVVRAGPCLVTQVRTPDRDGYSAVQLGFGERPAARVNKPEAGHFRANGVEPRRHLVEVRLADTGAFPVGTEVKADAFAAGDLVDVIGTTKGRGFTGVMKRHNFAGKEDSHGTERKHRSAGSVGSGTTPGRVFKGTRMAGRYGHERVAIMSLRVVESDPERDLLLIKGAIPGPTGSIVLVRNAAKAKAKKAQ